MKEKFTTTTADVQSGMRELLKRDKIVEMLTSFQQSTDKHDDAENALSDNGVDISNSKLFESFCDMSDVAIQSLALYILSVGPGDLSFNDICDVLNWYFYEYLFDLRITDKTPSRDNAQMFDNETAEPLCYDIESLVDYLMTIPDSIVTQ